MASYFSVAKGRGALLAIAVLILGMLTNGFDLLAVQDYWQDIVRGILIILAVSISFIVDRRLLVERQGHLGAAGYRVADAFRVFRADLAVVGDGEGVLTLSVLVDGEDPGDEAGADRIGLAGDRVDGDLHSADIRPCRPVSLERLCHGTGTGNGVCDWR